MGSDLNPLAVLLTGAKVNPPLIDFAYERLNQLEAAYQHSPESDCAPPEIQMLFDTEVTLPQLLYLRSKLSSQRKVDRYLLAVLVGILHGKHPADPLKSQTLSISMPNTFSMSPGYIRRYIEKNGLKKYPFDVFNLLRRRLTHLNRQEPPPISGRVICQDARRLTGRIAKQSVDLIVTSPPYLRVVKYGQYNWIRLWLLGKAVEEAGHGLQVAATDKSLGLSDQLNLPKYKKFISSCAADWERLLRPGGVCAVVIGDVRNRGKKSLNLAEEVWKEIQSETRLKLVDVVEDVLQASGKVTRIWGDRRGEATKVDRILVMKRTGARRYRTRSPGHVIQELAGEARVN